MDPLQWMGAARRRVQKADKTSQHNASPSINILWSEKLHGVYVSPILNVAFSS